MNLETKRPSPAPKRLQLKDPTLQKDQIPYNGRHDCFQATGDADYSVTANDILLTDLLPTILINLLSPTSL